MEAQDISAVEKFVLKYVNDNGEIENTENFAKDNNLDS